MEGRRTPTFPTTADGRATGLELTDGTTVQTVTVSATDVSNKYVTTTFGKPTDGTTLTVTALIKDTAGNTTTTASDSAYVDTTVPTQTLTFTSMTKASSPAASFFDRIEAVMRGVLSTVAVTSRTA